MLHDHQDTFILPSLLIFGVPLFMSGFNRELQAPDKFLSNLTMTVTQRSRPQCTHMTMNRLHGEHTCQQCGKVPSLGWVYHCQQDNLAPIRNTALSTEVLPLVPDHENYFEVQAEIARSIGMSASVVRQMRAGEYSYEQIEILLAQRRHVKEVIRQAETVGLGISPAVLQAGNALVMTPAGTPYNTPAGSASSSPTKKPVRIPRCTYQVCHACRPFFQDRLPMNVESVLNGEIQVRIHLLKTLEA